MALVKIIFFVVILTAILCPEFTEAVAKKQRRHVKHKKLAQHGKLKAAATSAKSSQRNGKMHFYNTHLWPTTTTYYRPATTSSLYQRSPATTSSTAYIPLHWSNSLINPSSLMPSSTLRRTDDFSSSYPKSTQSQTPVLSIPAGHSNSIMSLSNSQIPTLYDMSAFTGNAGLMETPFTGSSQNLWPMSETMVETAKPKLNLFNSFNYNDDGGLFSGFLNQFLK